MAIVYEWRQYDEGDTPGPWVPTTTLNDLAVNDHTTNASGQHVDATHHDYHPPDDLAFIHLLEARFRDADSIAFGATQVTFAGVAGGGVVENITSWQVFGTTTSGFDVLLGSGDTLDGSIHTITLDGSALLAVRVVMRLEKTEDGFGVEAMDLTDLRYTLLILPPLLETSQYYYRTATDFYPQEATQDALPWGPYIMTTTLADGLINDHITHANGDIFGGISDNSVAIGPATAIWVEALMVLTPSAHVASLVFSARTDNDGGGPSVPSGSYWVDILVNGTWIPLASGVSMPQNTYVDVSIGLDSTLDVADQVRVRIKQDRALLGPPDIAADIYDFRVAVAECVGPSEPISVTVVGAHQPASVSLAQFQIDWLPPTTGTIPFLYSIFRVREGLEADDVLLAQTLDVTFLQHDLSLDTQHCFYVVASNDCGDGPPSLIACDTVTSVIVGPTNFRDSGECEGERITFFWDLPADTGNIGGFRIYRDGTLVANLGNTVSMWIDEDPGIEVPHTYQLVTLNEAGEIVSDLTLTLTNVFACEWLDCTTENEPEEGEWTLLPI